jgi:hypothetical protein
MSIEIEKSVDAEAIGRSEVGRDDKPAEPSQALAIIVPTAIVRPAIASAMLVPRLAVRSGPPVDNGALQATFGKFRQFLSLREKFDQPGWTLLLPGHTLTDGTLPTLFSMPISRKPSRSRRSDSGART